MNHPYIAPSGAWNLGVKIGLPLAILGLMVILVWIGISIHFMIDEYVHEGAELLTLAGVIVLLLYVGGMLWAFWPLDSAYHQYRNVSGTVAKISSRLISAGDQGGTDQKFVVLLRGDPTTPFGVNDTRASLVHPGDVVHLRCIRTYDYGSTNAGYDCKWGR